jgi:S-adenosylmethionine:tRNA ribosyltransferase-isomerase
MRVAEFDFHLPDELIAREPTPRRGEARLMHLEAGTGRIAHGSTRDLPALLRPGDLLVLNDTKVFPADLHGRCLDCDEAVEVILQRPLSETVWQALVRPGHEAPIAARLEFAAGRLHAEVVDSVAGTDRRYLRFEGEPAEVERLIDEHGLVATPRYLPGFEVPGVPDRYQTVFARARGSVAPPSAALNLDEEVLTRLEARGVERAFVTLHVGHVTFRKIEAESVEEHKMEGERFEVSEAAAEQIRRAKADGRRVIAVGTTVTRTLEYLAARHGEVVASRGNADLFVYPGFEFKVLDGLFTGFQGPGSTLFLLVCAFGGTDRVKRAYREAIASGYRFYTYGDSMLIA